MHGPAAASTSPSDADGKLAGAGRNYALGWALDFAGDVDGDGNDDDFDGDPRDEVLVAAPAADPAGTAVGSVYLVRGRSP